MPGSGFAKSWKRDPLDDDDDGALLGQLGLVQLGLGHCLVIEIVGKGLVAALI